jgi:MFS superfamily sulfate permease-like transporter
MFMHQIQLKRDFPAGLVVFLVALPLCLGVAVASGAPAFSGIISGIIGGIIVGFLSKSHTSVSGPAAGLTAVILGAIQQLGSFEIFLSAVVLAGFLQLIFGLLKAGTISQLVPSSVINGLLFAIGLILILKQIPHAIGYDTTPEEDFSFLQSDGENTFSSLIKAFTFITPGALIIGLFSMLLLIVWKYLPLANRNILPSSLVVVVTGILINLVFSTWFPLFALEGIHTVRLPNISELSLEQFFHIPSIDDFLKPDFLLIGLTIAVIASLETLLNIEAIDKMDPERRFSSPNRELLAQGVGNIFAGLLGGIPVTSVIVRSSVNIEAKNHSKLSAIIHGVFILLSVMFLSPLINLIPLASLASILIITGYKLASPQLFIAQYRKGLRQFLPFIITLLAILFTDLLIGVLIGLGISIFNLFLENLRFPYQLRAHKVHLGTVTRLELFNQVSFLNKPAIKKILWNIPKGGSVLIDASNASYIDEDIQELFREFQSQVVPQKGIELKMIQPRLKNNK